MFVFRWLCWKDTCTVRKPNWFHIAQSHKGNELHCSLKKEKKNLLGLRTVFFNGKMLFRMGENYFLGIFWLLLSCICIAINFHLYFSLVYLMTLSVTQSRRQYSSASRLVSPWNSRLEGALFESRSWRSLRFRKSLAVHRSLSRQTAEYYIWATAFPAKSILIHISKGLLPLVL